MSSCLGILLLLVIIGLLGDLFIPLLLIGGFLFIAYVISLFIRKMLYFKSDEFKEQKLKVQTLIDEFNELSMYVKEIPNRNQFVSTQETGSNSHLAKYENTSQHNYKRNRNVKSLNKDNVHNASLAVVRRASEDPVKYLCKYFNIKPTEENLNQLEEIGTNISRLENAVSNLEQRKHRLVEEFNPPEFILLHFKDELIKKLDVDIPDIEIEYTKYIFEYVSPGGNSSQKTTITFNSKTIEAVEEYINEKIKYRKSAKAQRALMTNSLRNWIKERDDFTCQYCGASTYEQDLLLLEIDHIIPVSKGGLTTTENLQTLCWKCNRSKSDKVLNK